jgi:UDP-N-acetylmuramate dehydrogenase
VITRVTFRLPKAWRPLTGLRRSGGRTRPPADRPPDAQQIAAAVIAVRSRKLPDPATLPNAGSFFHNPLVDGVVAERLRRLIRIFPATRSPMAASSSLPAG